MDPTRAPKSNWSYWTVIGVATKDCVKSRATTPKTCSRFSTSAWVSQVIQWTNKSRYQSHKEGVVLARIEYHRY